jgi:competence protein ComGC
MNKKAFTFIELVVVITIIILISSTGVIYFFRQVSSIKIASEIEKVVDIVDHLDSEVDSKKILDYQINIKKSDKL